MKSKKYLGIESFGNKIQKLLGLAMLETMPNIAKKEKRPNSHSVAFLVVTCLG